MPWSSGGRPGRLSATGKRPARAGPRAGTGLSATALATWFEVRVVGVEPSEGMRRHARQARSHPGVAYVGGEAERLPLRDRCCGGAWLSTVIHHIGDLARCALELRRALEPDGRVVVRSCFPDRHERITMFRFFAGARRVAETFPTVEATVEAFATAGFACQGLRPVAQVSAPSLRASADRVRVRADSTLRLLPDEEFAWSDRDL